MFTILIFTFAAITLLGLCYTQMEATERDMAFLIKYHDIYHDSTH
jgi:hypothetical protein